MKQVRKNGSFDCCSILATIRDTGCDCGPLDSTAWLGFGPVGDDTGLFNNIITRRVVPVWPTLCAVINRISRVNTMISHIMLRATAKKSVQGKFDEESSADVMSKHL